MIKIYSEFKLLSGAWHLDYYYKNYRPLGSFSDNLLKFKNNQNEIVNKWSIWAKDEILELGIHFDYIIRALGSDELQPSGMKSLDYLGQYLQLKLGSLYIPEILQKKRITPAIHTLTSLKERDAALSGVYKVVNQNYNLNIKKILILDDMITTEATIRAICMTLYKVWPSGNYYLFCLGKSEEYPMIIDCNIDDFII